MIQGKDIESLVDLLMQRGVILCHACQFLDLHSYLSLGGIPSRACLEESGLPFTQFETDGDDHMKEVWDKIFMNFSDFGKTFADGHSGTPNPYGPILLEISSEVLNEAEVIAVCIQPVGSNGFINSELNSLKTISDIDRIFVYSADIRYPQSAWVKYKSALREEFGCSNPCDPDISCTMTSGKLSLKYVRRILVDPYLISGKPLRDWVAAMFSFKTHCIIQERASKREHLYNELASLIIKNVPSIWELAQSSYVSEELSEWAQAIERKNLGYQFKRFASYLRNGTLLELSS
jgi:hypothetical protein